MGKKWKTIEDIAQKYKNQNNAEVGYCQRPGCKNPIPESPEGRKGRRRKYCSIECAKMINYQRTMATPKYQKSEGREPINTQIAQRWCLKCGELFMSEGPWNRICPKCSEKNRNVSKRAEQCLPSDLSQLIGNRGG